MRRSFVVVAFVLIAFLSSCASKMVNTGTIAWTDKASFSSTKDCYVGMAAGALSFTSATTVPTTATYSKVTAGTTTSFNFEATKAGNETFFVFFDVNSNGTYDYSSDSLVGTTLSYIDGNAAVTVSAYY